jgi:hypothetical protein
MPFFTKKTANLDINMMQFMGFNATFNNISVIFWRSVLLVEETHRSIANLSSNKFEGKFNCVNIHYLLTSS